MVLVLPIICSEIDIPPAADVMELRRPDLIAVRSVCRRTPYDVARVFTDSPRSFRRPDNDRIVIAFGKIVPAVVSDHPGVRRRRRENGIGKCCRVRPGRLGIRTAMDWKEERKPHEEPSQGVCFHWGLKVHDQILAGRASLSSSMGESVGPLWRNGTVCPNVRLLLGRFRQRHCHKARIASLVHRLNAEETIVL